MHPPTLLLLALGTPAAIVLSCLPRGAGMAAVLAPGTGCALASEWLLAPGGGPRGNRMAPANIRQQPALHFDEEGRLEVRTGADDHEDEARIPCRPQPVAVPAR